MAEKASPGDVSFVGQCYRSARRHALGAGAPGGVPATTVTRDIERNIVMDTTEPGGS
jgi:hypothetical protein